MNLTQHLLTLCIMTPVISGILVWLTNSTENNALIRKTSLALSVVSFIPTLLVLARFNGQDGAMQMIEMASWIPQIKANYHLGIDGISIWFLPLTGLTTILVILAGWEVIDKQVGLYMGSFLVLSGLMIGVFVAQDGLLFYLFFEATLIPMYLIIGVWGGPNRVYAAFKFFLYTLLGSLLMLVALLVLYRLTGSFDFAVWYTPPNGGYPIDIQLFLFVAFFAAFAVKVPMWPFHTWLPDAHVEAPTGGSMVLAAIMLKLGTYGFMRFSLPITPDATVLAAPVVVALALIAVVYIGFVALVQQDMKKLVAYSSVAHMAFVILGLFAWHVNDPDGIKLGFEGALMQMLSHGLISAAMFFSIGVLYDRVHSRQIKDYGGVINEMPRYAAFAVFFSMANAALPGTSGFVGEFAVILSSIRYNFWVGSIAAFTLVLGAAYTLWMVKRVIMGKPAHDYIRALKDINTREFAIFAILAVLVLVMGIKPAIFTDPMKASIDRLVREVTMSKLPQPNVVPPNGNIAQPR